MTHARSEELDWEGNAQAERVLAFNGEATIIDHLEALGDGFAVGTIAVLEESARCQPGNKEFLLTRMAVGIKCVGPAQPAENGEGKGDQENGGKDGESTGHDEGILPYNDSRGNRRDLCYNPGNLRQE